MEDFEDQANPEQLDQDENRELQCQGCRDFFPDIMSHLKGNIDCQRGHGRGGYKRMLEAERKWKKNCRKDNKSKDQTTMKKVTNVFQSLFVFQNHLFILQNKYKLVPPKIIS